MEHKKTAEQEAIRQLDGSANRLGLVEHEQIMYVATVEQGTTREDILNPMFWAHVAPKLRPYTEITVRCDDGTLYAKLLVTQAERTWARVHVLAWHDLTTQDVAKSKKDPVKVDEDRYKVTQRGPVLKWCVMDTATNPPTPIREKEATRLDAITWLDGFLKTTA